jgi:hypothetical protein
MQAVPHFETAGLKSALAIQHLFSVQLMLAYLEQRII